MIMVCLITSVFSLEEDPGPLWDGGWGDRDASRERANASMWEKDGIHVAMRSWNPHVHVPSSVVCWTLRMHSGWWYRQDTCS